MSWFADLAGRAETLLNNLDEQTGAVLRNGNVVKPRPDNPTSSDIGQKKRLPLKNKRNLLESKSNFTPVPKTSPTNQSRPNIKSLDNVRVPERRKKSPAKKSPQYPLHNFPNTFENGCNGCGLRQRRFSLPSDLEILNHENFTFDMQNLEVENAMLKNEINVVNREISDLLDRLKKTENEFIQAQTQSEALSKINQRLSLDNEGLLIQLDDLRSKIEEVSVVELSQYRSEKQALNSDNKRLQEINAGLENDIRILREELHESQSQESKLENELRHTQTQMYDLEHELEKRKLECVRLENEWEAYKLRVKSMLFSKDNEIKALRDSSNLSEDTKQLIQQIDHLKEEREELSQGLLKVKGELSEMKQHMTQLEARNSNAERVVAALRDALKEERSARNKAEAQASAISKELHTTKVQTGQTVANLRAALRNKEEELLSLKDANSVPTTETSALNVGDYDVMQSIDNEKIQYLTHTVVQKQARIDSLLADNNMLKIQLDKLESKHKNESSLRARSHVLHVREERSPPPLHRLSLRMGLLLKRFPLLFIFIIFYMIGLHFWVVTVLLKSSPENFIRPTKA